MGNEPRKRWWRSGGVDKEWVLREVACSDRRRCQGLSTSTTTMSQAQSRLESSTEKFQWSYLSGIEGRGAQTGGRGEAKFGESGILNRWEGERTLSSASGCQVKPVVFSYWQRGSGRREENRYRWRGSAQTFGSWNKRGKWNKRGIFIVRSLATKYFHH